jgi:AcrR family transcriptional regulator
MARVVNEKEFAERRNQILEVAQGLIYSKGYEQVSIQDILDVLKMSKGAFYHYFESKPALLEAVIDKMIKEAWAVIMPIADAPNLNALEKFHLYFDTSARWKSARRDFLISLLRSWYNDDNLVIREKMTRSGRELSLPMLTKMVRQGIEEGFFKTPYPEQAAEMVMTLMLTLGDNLSVQILKSEAVHDMAEWDEIVKKIDVESQAYSDALDRILGSAPGSLKIMDLEMLKFWLITPP